MTDGPFIESKETIGGYWFIRAESLEEAVEIARGNPGRYQDSKTSCICKHESNPNSECQSCAGIYPDP